MSKEEGILMSGTVVKSLPNAMFKVCLDDGDHEVLAHVCGKIRKNFIKVLEGDRVDVELSPYDLKRGRITRREKDKDKQYKEDDRGSGKKSKGSRKEERV